MRHGRQGCGPTPGPAVRLSRVRMQLKSGSAPASGAVAGASPATLHGAGNSHSWCGQWVHEPPGEAPVGTREGACAPQSLLHRRAFRLLCPRAPNDLKWPETEGGAPVIPGIPLKSVGESAGLPKDRSGLHDPVRSFDEPLNPTRPCLNESSHRNRIPGLPISPC